MLCRSGCSSHQEKDERLPYNTQCDDLESRKRERERQGYGTALYKAKSCKQTDDCTNSVNYEANEKLKGSSNEKFDQMLFRLSFQVIKWSGKKKCSLRYILACDLLHSERKNAIKLGVSKSQFSF